MNLASYILRTTTDEFNVLPIWISSNYSMFLPACSPACLHACIPACMPAFLHACLPACMPACMHVTHFLVSFFIFFQYSNLASLNFFSETNRIPTSHTPARCSKSSDSRASETMNVRRSIGWPRSSRRGLHRWLGLVRAHQYCHFLCFNASIYSPILYSVTCQTRLSPLQVPLHASTPGVVRDSTSLK